MLPNQVIICERDPFERAYSAYKFGHDQIAGSKQLSFREAVRKEIELMQDEGGLRVIYEEIGAFTSFMEKLMAAGSSLPIVYPSFIMANYRIIGPCRITKNATFANIESKNISGLGNPLDASIAMSRINMRVNSSNSDTLHENEDQSLFKLAMESVRVGFVG